MNQYIAINIPSENVDFDSLEETLSDIYYDVGMPDRTFPGLIDSYKGRVLIGYHIEIPREKILDEYIALSTIELDKLESVEHRKLTEKEVEQIESGELKLKDFIYMQADPSIQEIYESEKTKHITSRMRIFSWQEFKYILAKLLEFCEPENSMWIYKYQSFDEDRPILYKLVEEILDEVYPANYKTITPKVDPTFIPQWYIDTRNYSH